MVELSCVVTSPAALQLRQDRLGQLLAQLHAPLVERVDAPDHALREDLVLVHREQHAQRPRRQLLEQDRVRRPVARERLLRHQRLELLRPAASSLASSARTSSGVLPFISASVCAKKLLTAGCGWCSPMRVVRLDRGQEVARDQLRPLVDELVEGVLAVRARLAPDHRAGAPRARLALACVTLLPLDSMSPCWKYAGEAVQVLVVGQDGVRLGAEEVVVPHAQHAQHDRQVLLQRRRAEVLVHQRAPPASSSSKLSMPIDSAIDSPMADHSE